MSRREPPSPPAFIGSSVELELDGDGCWPDLTEKHAAGKVVWNARLAAVSLIPDGEVVDGLTGEHKRRPIITLRVELPDGTTALAQIKLDMLKAIARAMDGRLAYLAELAAKGGAES